MTPSSNVLPSLDTVLASIRTYLADLETATREGRAEPNMTTVRRNRFLSAHNALVNAFACLRWLYRSAEHAIQEGPFHPTPIAIPTVGDAAILDAIATLSKAVRDLDDDDATGARQAIENLRLRLCDTFQQPRHV